MKGVGPVGAPDSRPDPRLGTLELRLGPGLGPGPEPPGGPDRLLEPRVCSTPGPSKGVGAEPGPPEEVEEEDEGIRGPEGGPLEGTGLEWSEPPKGEWYPVGDKEVAFIHLGDSFDILGNKLICFYFKYCDLKPVETAGSCGT